jgi:hypothetical protein
MSRELSARDMERASAYLDDPLTSRARAAFELRLISEPSLARALAELRETRALLRRAPQRRVPRSFALKAEMVSSVQKPLFGGWSSMNFVSAAATLVLMLVFAGDIWATGLPSFGAAAPAAEEAPQALMAQEPAAEDSALTSTPPAEALEGAGEIELYAELEADRMFKDETQFDLRLFLADYANSIEFGLAVIAIGAGAVALWQRRKA